MQSNKSLWVALIVIAIIAIGGYFTPNGQTIIKEVLGATPGTNFTNHIYLESGFTVGGSFASSSANSTVTMAARELLETNAYTFTPTVQDITVTLPASSTLSSFLGRGQTRIIHFRNATSTNGIDVTFAGNTGTILRGVHGTSTVLYDGMGAVVQFYRSATSTPLGDIYVTFMPE